MTSKSATRSPRKQAPGASPAVEEKPCPPLSLTAKILLALAVSFTLAYALRIWITPIKCPDLWFHMKAGEWIFHNHRLPAGEMFAADHLGRPWMVNAWLSEILLWATYRLGGYAGVVLGQALLSSLIFAGIALFTIRLSERPTLSVFVLLMAIVAGSYRHTTRPEIFSMALLAAMVGILYSYKFRLSDRVLWLIPMGLLWSNLHFGFTIAPVVLGCFMLGEWAAELSYRARRKPIPEQIICGPRYKRLMLAGSGMLIATLINPYGLRAWLFMQTLSGKLQSIQEWYPLITSDYTRPPWILGIALAMLALTTLALLMISRRPQDWSGILLAGVFAAMAWKYNRQAAQFCLVAPFVIAAAARGACLPRICRALRPEFGAMGALVAALGMLLSLCVGRIPLALAQYQPGFGVDDSQGSVRAISFIQKSGLAGRKLFNSMELGGWVTWNLWPKQMIYIDGRVDMYDMDSMAAYQRLSIDANSPDLLADEGFDYCYVRYPRGQEAGCSTYVARTLAHHPRWALVFFDESGMIYVRRDPANQSVIDQYQYQILNPLANTDLQSMDLSGQRAQLHREVERIQEDSPESGSAYLCAGVGLLAAGEPKQAFQQMETARRYGSRWGADSWLILEQFEGRALLESKDYPRAIRHFQAALRLIGKNDENHQYEVAALNDLGAAQCEAGRYADAEASLKRALLLNPEIPTTHYNQARVQMAQHRYEEAARGLEELLNSMPDAVDVRILMAQCLALSGHHEDALMQLESAAQTNRALVASALSAREFDPLRNDPRFRALAK